MELIILLVIVFLIYVYWRKKHGEDTTFTVDNGRIKKDEEDD